MLNIFLFDFNLMPCFLFSICKENSFYWEFIFKISYIFHTDIFPHSFTQK